MYRNKKKFSVQHPVCPDLYKAKIKKKKKKKERKKINQPRYRPG